MDGPPDDVVTIPSGALTIPLTTERTVLTALTAVSGVGACVSNLCANGAPGADITSRGWFDQTTQSTK